ncbi:MAG: hypothetical protein MUF18_16175 [Fimbriiglobus sp.]|jgi:hypothetical protein|nr:hypothetical protein [Fimbriiglobus sp.]
MSEPITTPLVPAPPANGPPPADADARLSRIEAALAVLAAQQAAGPPPEGYSRPGSPPPLPGPNPLTQIGAAVELAQFTGQLPGGGAKARRAWLKWPVIRELILVFRLYFDKRYSPTRAAQLGVPAILALLVLNWAFFYFAFTLPIVAQVLERLVIMAAAVFVYRILAAEVVRYAAVLEYLTKTGRG